jgi:hypothetical protein
MWQCGCMRDVLAGAGTGICGLAFHLPIVGICLDLMQSCGTISLSPRRARGARGPVAAFEERWLREHTFIAAHAGRPAEFQQFARTD